MKTEHFDDKARWGSGPWQDEPDKAEWRYKGQPCLIVRGPMGALCGYAGVMPGHPFYGKGYNDCTQASPCGDPFYCEHAVSSRLWVHGGLTYADACDPGGRICHEPPPGEEEVWWFGFDTAHGGDHCPKAATILGPGESFYMPLGGEYRTLVYVQKEVECLVDQLLAVR
jgi:hypothetical protein